jgi:hypothetical protein
VSPGWGGLDKEMIEAAGPNVFALGNVPHDWLFEWVSAVCHHGGAGQLFSFFDLRIFTTYVTDRHYRYWAEVRKADHYRSVLRRSGT